VYVGSDSEVISTGWLGGVLQPVNDNKTPTATNVMSKKYRMVVLSHTVSFDSWEGRVPSVNV
jgi:hypothetical protein